MVKCQSVNTGLMAAFIERKEMVSVFTGTTTRMTGPRPSRRIMVGYTRKTGYGSYGPAEG